jgi:Kef-type K+ transport system membrane component KefB
MRLDLNAVETIPLFLFYLVVAVVIGKLMGAGLPAFWMIRSLKEALIIGTGMNARGAVELIIADIALRQGLFSHPEPVPTVVASLFSAIVIMAVVTTMFTPIGLRWMVSNLPANKYADSVCSLHGKNCEYRSSGHPQRFRYVRRSSESNRI